MIENDADVSAMRLEIDVEKIADQRNRSAGGVDPEIHGHAGELVGGNTETSCLIDDEKTDEDPAMSPTAGMRPRTESAPIRTPMTGNLTAVSIRRAMPTARRILPSSMDVRCFVLAEAGISDLWRERPFRFLE